MRGCGAAGLRGCGAAGLREMVAELHETGAEFTRRWHSPAADGEHVDRLLVLDRNLALTRDALTADGDLKVMVFTPHQG